MGIGRVEDLLLEVELRDITSASVGFSWISAAFVATMAAPANGLDAAMLAGLLDLLSLCAFLAAQLADEGSADPSPLLLRLIVSSCAVVLVDPACGAAEIICGGC